MVFLTALSGFSQREIGLVASVSENISFSDRLVNGTILSLGTQLINDISTNRFYFSYLYEGSDGIWPIYEQKTHCLGITYEVRILGRKKMGIYFSPSLFTEVKSNNYARKLNQYGSFLPYDNVSYGFETNRYYVKTPMFLKLLVGGDFRVTKNVSFNFALGYGFKIYEFAIRDKYDYGNKFGKLHMLSLQMGFNYSISLSKRNKQ